MEKEILLRTLIVGFIKRFEGDAKTIKNEDGSFSGAAETLAKVWKLNLDDIPNWVSGDLIGYIPEISEENVYTELVRIGKTEFGYGQYDKARDFLSKALELNPNSEEIYNILANIEIKETNFQAASEYCQKSLQINPNNSHTYLLLGFCLWNMNKLTEARQVYQSGLEIAPDDQSIRQALTFIGPTEHSILPNVAELIEEKKNSPEFLELLQNEEISQMVQEIQNDPSCISKYSSSPSFSKLMEVLVGE